ncbi:hypothetical protein LPJ73_000914 [Coemansia sp. RSA 2703]|nr:hypothetical protein LPJ73_000914 [Coemansia sp. RSA 2703]
MPLSTEVTNDDGGQTVKDLLQLLENPSSDGLVGFLETEHRELLYLRHRVAGYEAALAELKEHLNQAFSAVGGLGALPISEATRRILETDRLLLSPLRPQHSGTSTGDANDIPTQVPMTPITPGNQSVRTPYESSASGHELSFRLKQPPPLQLPLDSAAQISENSSPSPIRRIVSGRTVEVAVQTDFDDSLALLQHTVAEQQADIEDLESSLRERKTLVRQLRNQLRDNELRQFAAASDRVGLRRTASIMVDTSSDNSKISNLLSQHHRTASASSDAVGGEWCKIAKPSRMSPVLSNDDISSHTSTISINAQDNDVGCSSSVIRLQSSHRPSRFINGWPVYDSETSDSVEAEKEPVIAKISEPATETNDRFLSQLLATPAVVYKQSVASELNADSKSTNSSSKLSTNQRLREAMTKTPRRIYSSLSNRLKRF